MSVGEVDVEDSVKSLKDKYDPVKVRALAYSNRFILLRKKARLWAFIGSRSDYIIVENLYCSCNSFTRRLTRQPICIHLVALELSMNLNRYRTLEASEEEIRSITLEILKGGFSRKLREKLYKISGIQRKQGGS